ncbi:serine hydrolase [Asanoa ishikariensis]|uniref:Beta-lactamase n=1 Tax=Asanoa ishikariensis TaxID=137265 RepID=A0A1H3S7Q1_9ACTN|nr:serine hydrolase [Asanoa ishikariensis]GIF70320.1 serine hydrolase [Asanoa ishikariensis]SDZ34056.1 Beta-lactamase class A [Asanoa ishikariensis]
MITAFNRRTAIGLGTMATAGAVLGLQSPAAADPDAIDGAPVVESTPQEAAAKVGQVYQREIAVAKGNWHALVTVASTREVVAVADQVDTVVEAYSVNKLAVAIAVLDKVDRKLLSLTQRVNVTSGIVAAGGDGIFRLDGAYPSSVTLGHVLAALLTVSDDTASRLCGLVAPAAEINQILRKKGFTRTQVQPVGNPNQFYLGRTTPREMHTLLRKLVAGKLLSAASTRVMLSRLRSPIAFTDGIRREMSSLERGRIATKAGWFGDGRHEAGIIFSKAGRPVLTYSIFANGQGSAGNFGATHPAVRARARMGRAFLDAVNTLPGDPAVRIEDFDLHEPSNGG